MLQVAKRPEISTAVFAKSVLQMQKRNFYRPLWVCSFGVWLIRLSEALQSFAAFSSSWTTAAKLIQCQRKVYRVIRIWQRQALISSPPLRADLDAGDFVEKGLGALMAPRTTTEVPNELKLTLSVGSSAIERRGAGGMIVLCVWGGGGGGSSGLPSLSDSTYWCLANKGRPWHKRCFRVIAAESSL